MYTAKSNKNLNIDTRKRITYAQTKDNEAKPVVGPCMFSLWLRLCITLQKLWLTGFMREVDYTDNSGPKCNWPKCSGHVYSR